MATQTERQEREAWYSHAGDVRRVTIVPLKKFPGEWRVKGRTENRFHGYFDAMFFETEAEALDTAIRWTENSLRYARGTVKRHEQDLDALAERISKIVMEEAE